MRRRHEGGTPCSNTSDCKLLDSAGKLVAAPLQRGGNYCTFHATLFCTRDARVDDAILMYIDLETTGLDIASDSIVEIGVVSGCGAVFSTVVRPEPMPPDGPTVHGIANAELEQGPSFPIAFARLVSFFEDLSNAAICEHNDSSQEDVDMLPTMPIGTPRVVLVGHNSVKFDFPFLLSECMRQEVPMAMFEEWRYVDTLHLICLLYTSPSPRD